MSATLLDSFRSLLTPDTIASVAARFGESDTNVSRGLTSGFGSILMGLLGKVGDSGAMHDVHGLLTQAGAEAGAAGDSTTLLGGSTALGTLGSRLLSMVFGGTSAGVAEAISRTSGIKTSTASSLLSMVAPAVLGLLGRRVRTEGLSAEGLGSLLTNEAASIRSIVPAGLGSLLGVEAPLAGVRRTVSDDVGRRGSMGWAWLAVAAAAILAIIWFASRSPGPEMRQTAMDTASPAPAAAPNDVQAYSPGNTRTLTLPGGTALAVADSSLEARLVGFIEDSSAPVSKDTWFDFDQLLFETGSATLKPASEAQLRNVATILRAFPEVHAKIGGYTDSVGDDAANQRLSEERARSVMDRLVSLGITSDRLEAEGYGEQHPVASNETESGQAQNRRIALRVTEK
jgi:outer membrane protein OmpA-like peptidoglycan-associated protein